MTDHSESGKLQMTAAGQCSKFDYKFVLEEFYRGNEAGGDS
jgi:hypothetical protein